MKSRTLLALSVSLSSILLTSCAVSPAQDPDKTYHITILHTNDHHGHFWKNEDGEYGMAARQTLIRHIREEVTAEGGSVLLLSAGDINTGVPESDLQNAEPDIRAMNAMGYDAMTVGNHEFDNAPEVLAEQQKLADFPFLSANIYRRENQKRSFTPYKIFNLQGNRIAVMGLTTEDTQKIGNPEYTRNLDFRSPVQEARKMVPSLRKKSDLVIALSHLGYYRDAQYGSNAPGDVTLARSVNGIDVIIGGHSHTALSKPDLQNNTLILQAFEWGKYLGRLDLDIKNGKITHYDYHLIPVNLKADSHSEEIPEDGEMLALLSPYQQKGAEALGQKIAVTDIKLEGDREVVRSVPTNLGTLIATAQMQKAHADLAIMNSGGIRDSIRPGDITYKDVLKVQPFANMLTYVELSGSELQSYLDAAAEKQPESGAFAQFAGVSMQISNGKAVNVQIGGRPLDNSRTYRMAVNSFMASGGDGYPDMTKHSSFVNTGFVDADVLADFLKQHSPVKADQYQPAGITRN